MSHTTLMCPVCATPMASVEHHHITIDICNTCKGAWFDAGELKALIAAELQERDDIPDAPITKPGKVVLPDRMDEDQRICPRCDAPMHKVNYGYDSNVVVDHCTACDGMWADTGEVYDLAVYMKGNPTRRALGEALLGEARYFSTLRDISGAVDALQKHTALPRLLPALAWFGMVPAGAVTAEDGPATRRFPVVTALLVLASLISVILYKVTGFDPRMFGFVPRQAFYGSQPYTLVTYGILYGGFIHLLFVMVFLWLFGDNVEDRFGRAGYLGFFLGALVLAAAQQSGFHRDQTIPVIGGGAAVSAILGAYLALHAFSQISVYLFGRSVNVPVISVMTLWILAQMGISLWAVAAETAVMPWYIHVILFIVGLVTGLVVKKITAPVKAQQRPVVSR